MTDAHQLIEFVTGQRWFGSKTREVIDASVVDSAPLRDTLGDFPIFPAVAVSYEREVYQGEETWRVTIDTGVEFFRVEPRLALSSAPLRRELLGEPAGREERTIVEVKYLDGPVKHLDGPVPAWALSSGGARRYSKFTEAMRQVHGVGETRAVARSPRRRAPGGPRHEHPKPAPALDPAAVPRAIATAEPTPWAVIARASPKLGGAPSRCTPLL